MHLVHRVLALRLRSIWARMTAWTSRCTWMVLVPRSTLASEYRVMSLISSAEHGRAPAVARRSGSRDSSIWSL